jgi:hypothetical protein
MLILPPSGSVQIQLFQHSLHNSTSSNKLKTFVILTKEKTTVWVKQNGNFFQQNDSVIKIEQN